MSKVTPPKISYVYQIKNLVNDKSYIGKTTDVDRRWKAHQRLAIRKVTDQVLHHAMRKYGIENFEVTVLEALFTEELAFEREIELIREYNTVASNGYNLNEGGEGGSNPTPEICQKITDALTGVKHSKERRQRESESRMGSGNPMHGRKHNPETIQKMRDAWQKRRIQNG